MDKELRVGQVAERTGVSVRTLHYYEEINLLQPAYRTESNQRIYGREQMERLQRIRSLVHLGLSLDEVKGCLADPDFDLGRVLALHVQRLDQVIEQKQQLRSRLHHLLDRVRGGQVPTLNELLGSIEETIMFEKYYSPEQLKTLEQRRDALGADGMARAQKQWADLIAEVRAAMERGESPTSPGVQDLARQWQSLVRGFTGGDSAMAASASQVWKQEGDKLRQQHGDGVPDPQMFEFIAEATKALESEQ